MTDDALFDICTRVLREELIPAMGCTEPAAIALAAARARRILGRMPEHVVVRASGNVIKNAHSVVVPATGGLRGIEAAAAAGVTLGDEEAGLGVLAFANQPSAPAEYLRDHVIEVSRAPVDEPFYLEVIARSDDHEASVLVRGHHLNTVAVLRDGVPVEDFARWMPVNAERDSSRADRSALSVSGIVRYADNAPLSLFEDIIQRQIDMNTAISRQGLEQPWGAQIGRVLLDTLGNSVPVRARAAAAAGSDARMSGCELPVVIVSGSGNQGLTASLPVIEYARALNVSDETMIRALALSSLVTIHQKECIGCLSAFCGAVSAGCGAGAGIAYLHGGGYDAVAHTIVNALAVLSGMICDGAKPSCAAKIAVAVDAGILGYTMYAHGQQFLSGDGILRKGVEANIQCVGRVASRGMRDTDREILDMMLLKQEDQP